MALGGLFRGRRMARGFAEQRENPARAPARVRSPQSSLTASKAYNRREESSTSLGARAPAVDEGAMFKISG